ncbi:hypothetical protein ACP4OV_030406 [Aristida adscensionis]
MARLPVLLVAAAVAALTAGAGGERGFVFEEATIDSMHQGFHNGSLTSAALVGFYLDQIARLNPLLRAVIEVNPDALRQAARADAQRERERSSPSPAAAGRRRGGLHGIPVLVKDLIATRDGLNTTAGSLALLGAVARRDAGVVARLRRAGAVVLGKASLPEWANFRSARGLLQGWSSRGGRSRDPYVLSASLCGSSTGSSIATAANMAAAALGTETMDSILCPASRNAVVGIKPTVGLTSRAGVIPFTPRQDTVGPICRTVADAVHVLDAIVGYDELDGAATRAASKYIPPGGYTQFLRIDGLNGKRIGIPNGFFDFSNETVREIVYKQHVDTMREHGATVIENLEIANLSGILGITNNGLLTALTAEFKFHLNNYLSNLSYSPVRSLADIIAFNNAHPVEERIKEYGQQILLMSENTTGIGPQELAIIHQLEELSENGVVKLIKDHQLDAILTPDSSATALIAYIGLPGIVVPAGYDERGVPFSICYSGLKGYEPRLIEMAYAFEQATKVRRQPTFKD